MTYAETLAALFGRARAPVKLGLAPMRRILAALGHPEARMTCVLVAGTNGKGSTCRLLAAALQADGQKVGLYTSPHLLRFTERIRIQGQEVGAAEVCRLYAEVAAAEARAGVPLSFFECGTAMAMLAFAAAGVQVAVLEVGLGGRLDATNAIPHDLAVITRIDLDHQAYLGDTLAAIAAEKADIIVPQRPVVMAPQAPEAQAVIEAVAAARRAPLHAAVPLTPLPAALPAYQAANLGCATAAAKALGCRPAAVAQALATFDWAGRYQWIEATPPLLLDGAHNPGGMRALLAALDQDGRATGRPWHGIFAALQDKEAAAMLAPLAERCQSLQLCTVGSRRSLTAAQLRALGPHPVHPHVPAALAAARAAAGPQGLVVVAGSLFLVAEVLATALGLPADPPVDG